MTYVAIIAKLKILGEYAIQFHEDGTISSRHGKQTYNTWVVRNGQLICIDCHTKSI